VSAPRLAALTSLAAALLAPALGQAEPQINAGWETGLCGHGSSLGFDELGWCNALHADLMLLRERSRDFGLGPALRLGTVSFDDFRLGGGLSLLLPVLESFPLVLEAGPQLRNFEQAGVYGSLFWGLRSYNHYGSYEMAGGLALTVERSFSDGGPSVLWLTARIDSLWLAMPFLLAYNALR
jgi:hypothetical protein